MFVMIVGGGKTGSYLAELLLAEGHRVKVLESRPEVVEKLKKEFAEDIMRASDRLMWWQR